MSYKVKKLENIFPIEIWRIIYSYDPTYKIKWNILQKQIKDSNTIKIEINNQQKDISFKYPKLFFLTILSPLLCICGCPLICFVLIYEERILRRITYEL